MSPDMLLRLFIPSLALASLITLSACAGGSLPAFAVTRYVDGSTPGGVDCSGNYSIANRNCTGSNGSSFNTLQEAMSASSPGDITLIRAGTYLGINTNRQILNNGTPGNPITYKAYNNETVELCFMNITDSGIGGPKSYLIFDTIRLTCRSDGPQLSVGNTGPYSTGTHHITFLNMTVANGGAIGCVQWGTASHHLTMTGGSVFSCGYPVNGSAPVSGEVSYNFYVGGEDQVLENLEVYDCALYCFHVYSATASQRPNRYIIRNNLIHGSASANLSGNPAAILVNGNDHQIYNNLIYDCHSYGLAVLTSNNVKIYNNIVDSCFHGFLDTQNGTVRTLTNLSVYNNIAHNTGTHFSNASDKFIYNPQGLNIMRQTNMCTNTMSGSRSDCN